MNILGSASTVLFDQFEDETYFEHAEAGILFRAGVSFCPTEYVVGMLISVSNLKACVACIQEICPS